MNTVYGNMFNSTIDESINIDNIKPCSLQELLEAQYDTYYFIESTLNSVKLLSESNILNEQSVNNKGRFAKFIKELCEKIKNLWTKFIGYIKNLCKKFKEKINKRNIDNNQKQNNVDNTSNKYKILIHSDNVLNDIDVSIVDEVKKLISNDSSLDFEILLQKMISINDSTTDIINNYKNEIFDNEYESKMANYNKHAESLYNEYNKKLENSDYKNYSDLNHSFFSELREYSQDIKQYQRELENKIRSNLFEIPNIVKNEKISFDDYSSSKFKLYIDTYKSNIKYSDNLFKNLQKDFIDDLQKDRDNAYKELQKLNYKMDIIKDSNDKPIIDYYYNSENAYIIYIDFYLKLTMNLEIIPKFMKRIKDLNSHYLLTMFTFYNNCVITTKKAKINN